MIKLKLILNFTFGKNKHIIFKFKAHVELARNLACKLGHSTLALSDTPADSNHLTTLNFNMHNQSCLTHHRTNDGDSIVSTAEEHLTQHHLHLQPPQDLKFKPKSTSSTTSLLELLRKKVTTRSVAAAKKRTEISGVTFNVECASTPKKRLPRSSTPKTLLKSSTRRERPLPCHPFSSTVISVHKSGKAKSIPPPLLSSSTYRVSKRKNSRSSVAAASTCKQCSVKKSSTRRLSTKLTRQSMLVEHVVGVNMQPGYFKNFKFPIKFLPNRKTKDIDRLASGHECNMKPVLKSCYSFGDYNVWIV